jgi:NitT/TauT family transport system substrate-binding protein
VASNRRDFLVCASAGILGIAASGCSGCNTGINNRNSPLKRIRIGYLPMVSSLTYFVAVENGYFVDEQLDIDAKSIKSSDDMAQDLINGHIDLAVELAIVPLLQSMGKGAPNFSIFSVSKIVEGSAFDGILVKKDSGLNSLASLSKKKLATFSGSTSPASIEAVFRDKCPGVALPEFVKNVRPGDQLNALEKGEVDAIHAYEPVLTIGKKKSGFVEAFGSIYAAQLSPNPIGVAAVNREFANGHRDECSRAISALDKAVKYIRDKPQDARDILAKYTKVDPNICRDMQIMPMSYSTEDCEAILDQYLKILLDLKQYTKPVSARELRYEP